MYLVSLIYRRGIVLIENFDLLAAGEIKNLSSLIKPHIGVITNIGEAHIENFRSVNGIAKAKSEIIESIVEGGTIILNRDDKFFSYLSKKTNTSGTDVT